jgi:hypothetical protein
MGPRTAGEKRKRVKDPNKPKRALSAWFVFMAHHRKEANQRGEDTTRVAQFTKDTSVKWRALTPAEKVPYEKIAGVDKARYQQEMATFKGKKLGDPNKPKRPQSAYFLWLGQFRVENKHRYAHKELLSKAGEVWNSLNDQEKAPWAAKAEIERQKYEEVMRNYNAGKAAEAKRPRMDAGGDAANGGADEDDDDDYEDDSDE